MSHVDEGTLHALLDGALAAADPAGAERVELHLAACPDCRVRLEDAARVRDEAGALLGGAQPRALATPSFDAIRARAAAMSGDEGRTQADAARRSRRLAFLATPFNGFAWAASVVLAVGLGWLLHDTVGGPETPALREMSDRAAASGADQAPPPAVAILEESAPAPTPAPSAGVGAASGLDARARPDARASARAPEEGMVPQGFQTLAPPPPPPPADAARRAEAPTRAEYDIEAADAVAEEGAATGDLAAAGAPATPPALAASDGWRSIAPGEADDLAGGELARLDGATLIAAAARGAGRALEVRTVQMTGRGETVTLVQRRADGREAESRAAATQAERPALESATTVTVRLGDWSVTISAPVARERLEQLADDLD